MCVGGGTALSVCRGQQVTGDQQERPGKGWEKGEGGSKSSKDGMICIVRCTRLSLAAATDLKTSPPASLTPPSTVFTEVP